MGALAVLLTLESCSSLDGSSQRTAAEEGLKWRLPPLARAVHLHELPLRSLDLCPEPTKSTIAPALVALAIDTSGSTGDAADSDVNDNGHVGRPLLVERTDGRLTTAISDLGDTILAAEISGSRSLAHDLANRGVPVALVAFAGSPGTATRVASLSTEIWVLEQAFHEILASGSAGSTDLAAGIALARASLSRHPPTSADDRRVVLLVSDESSPARQDEDTIRSEARRASDEGIAIHTFAVVRRRQKAEGLLGEIARLGGGTHQEVVAPTQLHCALAAALGR